MCEIIKLNPSATRAFNSFAKLVKELMLSAYKNILKDEDLEEFFNLLNIKSLRKSAINNNDEYFLIKNKENEAGFFQIRQLDDYLHLVKIFIKNEYKNKKIGYKTFLKIIKLANEKNLKKIIIYINKEFKDAQKAIQKWGFEGKKLTARYIGDEKFIYEYYYEFAL